MHNQLNISTESCIGLITLLQFPGIGNQKTIQLATKFPTLNHIYSASKEELGNLLTPNNHLIFKDLDSWKKNIDFAENQLKIAAKFDVVITSIFNQNYPILLKLIPDPPPVLYVQGFLDPNNYQLAACVGTRKPSLFGIEVSKRIVRELVQNGYGIVSGLALGIDTISHKEALGLSGYTIAILANSLDTRYPKNNALLADEILKNNGAILSESPFGTPALPQLLIKRDRLQSGLSIATFVMQTDLTGGTMHTVRYSIEQNRLIFVPNPPESYQDEEQSTGIIALGNLTGLDLSKKIHAKGIYKRILETKFKSIPPAYRINSKLDYGNVIDLLINHMQLLITSGKTNIFPTDQLKLI